MSNPEILHPVLAMILLAFVVWIVMFVTRLKFIAAEKIESCAMDTPEKLYSLLPPSALKSAYNFKNMFEVPVLFMAMCFYLYLTGLADNTHVICAWVFVGFRVLHSLVHCSSNNVDHRFAVYLVSCIALWVMLVRALLAAI
ncbi:MAG: MAPEG family protein [Pseudomonadales bacterium]